MNAIEAVGLHKRFREVRAVNGIDLAVGRGEVVGLLGPNGAGKTTTLMMLLGVTEPDAGHVSLLGHRLPAHRNEALQETNFMASYVGMPQRAKVSEILRVFAGLYRQPRSRVEEVIDLIGIRHLANRSMTQLSSGQRTLVGLAKSLINRPKLLILDEPTASLDPEIATRIRRILMSAWSEERFTLLITSHNMSEIEQMCPRVVFVGHGRVVADGSPKQICERYGADNLEGSFLSIAAEVRR